MPAKRQTRSTVKVDEDVQEVKSASPRKTPAPKAKTTKAATKASTSRAEVEQPVASTSKAPAKKSKKAAEEEVTEEVDVAEPIVKSKKPAVKKTVKPVTIESDDNEMLVDEPMPAKTKKSVAPARKPTASKTTKPAASSKKPPAAAVELAVTSSPPREAPAPPVKKASPPKKPVKEPPFTEERAMKLFDTYADPEDKDMVDGDGLQRLFEDAEIDMSGILPFLLAFESKALHFGSMKRDDWQKMSFHLQADSPARIRVKLEERNALLGQDIRYNKSPTYWEDFYGWLYKHLCEPGQKSVGIEIACAVWDLLFTGRSTVGLDWVGFLKTKELKGISPDVWTQIGLLAQTVELGAEPERQLIGYKEEDAWPSLVDEYAVWVVEGRPGASA